MAAVILETQGLSREFGGLKAVEGVDFTLCEVQAGADLRLFHSGPDGLLGSFGAVNDLLASEGKLLSRLIQEQKIIVD